MTDKNTLLEERKQRLSLTLLFSGLVFVFLLGTMLLVSLIVYLLVRAGVLQMVEGSMRPGSFIVLIVLASILIGTVLSMTVGRFPLRSVNYVINTMNRLAAGDFRTRLEFTGPFRNLPVIRELTESFNKMASELESTEMLRSDFINNFSHEFKTPIVSIAGFAKLLKKEGHRPLLAACDVYRPAAIDQLQVVGQKADVKVFEMGQIDPVVIAKQALAHAKDYGHDVLIIDTAGRLHIDEALMDELVKIKEETQPTEIMLVVDAMTGQDAVNVAKAFDDAVGITGVLMSKLDSDTRGGAALSVLSVTGKPIKFVGMGEKLDDFEQFHPERMASRILGMGDVLTLIEKAENVMSQKDAEKLTKKFKENKFDMDDLLDQMKQIKRMGSMKSILGMLPGVGDKIKDADIDESQLGRIEAMITSMTKAERAKPSIINPSRKKRIANGSGTKVEDVNRLLKQFDQMQTMMKKFTGKSGKMSLRKARKNLAGMNFDKYTGKGGGNLPF